MTTASHFDQKHMGHARSPGGVMPMHMTTMSGSEQRVNQSSILLKAAGMIPQARCVCTWRVC